MQLLQIYETYSMMPLSHWQLKALNCMLELLIPYVITVNSLIMYDLKMKFTPKIILILIKKLNLNNINLK